VQVLFVIEESEGTEIDCGVQKGAAVFECKDVSVIGPVGEEPIELCLHMEPATKSSKS
jgi:hypothetical protein